jgi:FtsX-like permease family
MLTLAWYRFRSTLGRRWPGYLTIVLLVGLVGGVAMGAVAGARRTQSAFPSYLTSTKASDLELQASSNITNLAVHQIQSLGHQLERLPDVARVAIAPNLLVIPLGPDGRPLPSAVNNDDVSTLGSDDGEYLTQDRVIVAQGRMADPKSPSEIMATAEAARLSGWHVGQTISFGAFTGQQVAAPSFNIASHRPAQRFSATLVGLVVFSSQVVNDDVDRLPTYILATPALTRRLRASEIYPSFGLRLADGAHDDAKVEKEIVGLLPPGTTYTFHLTSVAEGQVERSSKPEAIALAVFGGIAALAALLIAGLAIGRAIGNQDEDIDALRALGAGPLALTCDAMLGILGAVVLGSLLALTVAIALSPLAPVGPGARVDPSPGIAYDWTVLGGGIAILILGLVIFTVALAYRTATHRELGRGSDRIVRGSTVVTSASRIGLPVSAIAGLRFALERGTGRSAVPVRSALVGAVLAVAVVVTTLTFASGLRTLDSQPALYGWNWSYAISSPGGSSVPPVTFGLLKHDPDVAAWTGYDFADVAIDGQTVPILLSPSHAALNPPILSGRPLETKNQIVLGAATLAALHKKVGDTVMVSYGSPQDAPVYVPPTPLRVVGTATLPALGTSGALHPSMGTGAMINLAIESPSFKKAISQPDPNLNGFDVEVVRLRHGISPSAGLASLRRITSSADRLMASDPEGQGDVYQVLGVQRPAEIVNYQTTGATPGILAAGLATGAVVALGLTLAASVRRRRRDFALLKTLGFSRRQLALAVAWQASVSAFVGIIVGVPIGIALGRWLWVLFARGIYAVPKPSVPVFEIVLVALGALVLANLVAAVPGRMAARTRTSLVLRTE